jgi:hypothetical protein
MSTNWFETVQALVGVGLHEPCQWGHTEHQFDLVSIDLAQSQRFIPDIPVAGDLKFQIASFVVDPEELKPGYCTSNCAVSRALREQGTWEGFDTLLHMSLLDNEDDGIFMDFGANLGWYTIMSRLVGRDVISFEADGDLVKPLLAGLAANEPYAQTNGPGHAMVHGWIDDDTPVLPAEGAPDIRLVKSDVEGSEYNVLRILRELFDAGKIDYMMLELSPMFGGWDRTQEELALCRKGYQLSIVPDKGFSTQKFESDPITCSVWNNRNPNLGKLKTQETGFLVRRDLL